MGANRSGENRRRKVKRHVKNLRTMWEAQDRAAAAATAPKKKSTKKSGE